MAESSSARVVVDLELGRGFGYGLADLSIAGYEVAVTWDDVDGFRHWGGAEGRELLDYMLEHGEIVGFNLLAYDNPVLSGYLLASESGIADELKRRTIDLHALLYVATGRRHGLNSVAYETLGERKLVPGRPLGLDGDPILFAAYCERDVELTRDLDDFRRSYGVLYVSGGAPVSLGNVERGARNGARIGTD